MIVIPAIDLKDGVCVRLLQGRAEEKTVYSQDPSSVARRWQEAGAKCLHVVDLDGAFSGTLKNMEALKGIMETVSIPVQFGGGIRDEKRIRELLESGIWRVVLGTAAQEDETFLREACHAYPGRVAVGVDVRGGKAAVRGWKKDTGEDALAFALRCEQAGASSIIFTDISRDGTLAGPNLEAIREFAMALSTPVVASGGISSLEDIGRIMELEIYGVEAVIVGKALYTGAIDLTEAIAMAEEN